MGSRAMHAKMCNPTHPKPRGPIATWSHRVKCNYARVRSIFMGAAEVDGLDVAAAILEQRPGLTQMQLHKLTYLVQAADLAWFGEAVGCPIFRTNCYFLCSDPIICARGNNRAKPYWRWCSSLL